MAEHGATFKQKTVHDLLQMYYRDKKTKLNTDAQELVTELLRIFVTEAAMRSAQQAKNESSQVVSIDHFEKILPQMLLDF